MDKYYITIQDRRTQVIAYVSQVMDGGSSTATMTIFNKKCNVVNRPVVLNGARDAALAAKVALILAGHGEVEVQEY